LGPLNGIRIVEFTGIGPGPMAAMLLADLGATVLRLDRIVPSDLGVGLAPRFDLFMRGRSSVAVDLKHPAGVEFALKLLEAVDASIEGFRPGTMERLGLGPDVALAGNPRLVYGRMTGFGQSGPLAAAAGHDLNYIALTGALAAIGRKDEKPVPPLNLLGDFAGGSLYLALGIVCALLEARTSGQGQVIDAAIIDGTAHLMTMIYGLHAAGFHSLKRGENLLDSGSPIYDVYECADGRFISIAAIEPKFQATLFELLGIEKISNSEELRAILEARFRSRTRDEWCQILEGTDACFAPVLTLAEAPHYHHNRLRSTFIEIDGIVQPAPAPRFSRSRSAVPRAVGSAAGADTLRAWGIADREIQALKDCGAIRFDEAELASR
jgi:alpha-methylacyl-CoA racemase